MSCFRDNDIFNIEERTKHHKSKIQKIKKKKGIIKKKGKKK